LVEKVYPKFVNKKDWVGVPFTVADVTTTGVSFVLNVLLFLFTNISYDCRSVPGFRMVVPLAYRVGALQRSTFPVTVEVVIVWEVVTTCEAGE